MKTRRPPLVRCVALLVVPWLFLTSACSGSLLQTCRRSSLCHHRRFPLLVVLMALQLDESAW